MKRELHLRSRQHARTLSLRQFRRVMDCLLVEFLGIEEFEVGITFVGASEMTRLNQSFLQHDDSTDVITFDYSGRPSANRTPGEGRRSRPMPIHGELFICVEEAIVQARRFGSTWQSELVRYAVHGILHLLGHDDHGASKLRRMKREENRLLRELTGRFVVSHLAGCTPGIGPSRRAGRRS